MSDEQWRVQFDAEVRFANGGDLRVRDFRLDIPGEDVSEGELAELLVRLLGLLMVGEVEISGKTLIREAHKGSRGMETGPRVRRLVELSHVLKDGMATVPGLPAPRIGAHETHAQSRSRYARGTEFHFASISMVGNTGTYVDAPLHRYEDGTDLAGVALESLADLEGLVVRAEGLPVITRELLLPLDVRGRAVLVHTGWSRHWGTEEYLSGHPHLTEEAAEFLVEEGAALLGIDSQNVDGTRGGERPVHSRLLAAGIPIVEHMTGLDLLPPHGFRLHAAPPRIAGVGTFPVRAYAIVTEE